MSAPETRRDRFRRVFVDVTREVYSSAVRTDVGREPTPEILDWVLKRAAVAADQLELPARFDELSDEEVAAVHRTDLTRKFAARRRS
jgi:hypothetical protein